MTENSYMKLDVWKKSMDIVSSIYTATKLFPKEELYTLTSQMRRAAISIPSNIAEGRAKRTTPEFMRFINIASGSTAELSTQTVIAEKLGYIAAEQAQILQAAIASIGRMLNGLHGSLDKKCS